MKKFLTLMAILLAILIGFLEFVLPKTLSGILEEQITNSTGAQAVNLDLSSSPNFKIAAGIIDKIHGTASSGRLGEIDFKELSLDGEKISLDVKELLFPEKEIPTKDRMNKILQSAEKLEMHGIITEEDLKSYIATKVDRLENAEVKISPEEISATGQVKIMGRTADVDLAGKFIADDGDIYFQMTRLNVRNALLRHVSLDRFLGDVKILESEKLPLGMKFDSVELREGEAVIAAVRKN